MKGAIQQKPKDRPRKARIKAKLKRIVIEYNVGNAILIGLLLSFDIIDDGVVNASFIGGLL